MSRKMLLVRFAGRWGLRLLIVILILFSIQMTLLAFPQLLMPHSAQFGTVKIYTDGPDKSFLDRLATATDRRLQLSGFCDSNRTDRVFIFQSDKLYLFYLRLSLLRGIPQGFNLSVFGNSYVSVPMNTSLGERSGRSPKYSIYDGDLSHLIAHEIAHQYLVDSIGRTTWQNLPHWKREGLPEYIANIGLIREDSLSTLAYRIDVLNDQAVWLPVWGDQRHEWDRIHYAAGLMAEYLFETCGYTLEDIIADSVKEERVRAEMQQLVPSPPGAY